MTTGSRAIYASLAGDLAVAAAKLVAAGATGSSSMFSEGLHSIVDAGSEVLLLLGRRRSAIPPDEAHPFGHGQELYFWTLIVSLIIFTGGGAVSIYEGIQRLLHPSASVPSVWSYVVLGAATVFEIGSFIVGYSEFRKAYPNQRFWKVLRTAKDPTLFTVVLQNTSDLVGLVVAFFGVFLTARLGVAGCDGIASIVIGLVLTVVAVLLLRESKGLLTGESADPAMRRRIRAILQAEPMVQSVGPPLTMYFGPETVLLAVDIQFGKELTTMDLPETVERLEGAVQSEFPQVKSIFIEAACVKAARERSQQEQRR